MNKETINLETRLGLPCSWPVEIAALGGGSEVARSWSCKSALTSAGATSRVGVRVLGPLSQFKKEKNIITITQYFWDDTKSPMKLTKPPRQHKTCSWPSASTSPVPYLWPEGLISDPIMLTSARSIFAEGGVALTGIKTKGLCLPTAC